MHFVAIFVSHLFSRQTSVRYDMYTRIYIYIYFVYIFYFLYNELERILFVYFIRSANEGVCFFVSNKKGGKTERE